MGAALRSCYCLRRMKCSKLNHSDPLLTSSDLSYRFQGVSNGYWTLQHSLKQYRSWGDPQDFFDLSSYFAAVPPASRQWSISYACQGFSSGWQQHFHDDHHSQSQHRTWLRSFARVSNRIHHQNRFLVAAITRTLASPVHLNSTPRHPACSWQYLALARPSVSPRQPRTSA